MFSACNEKQKLSSFEEVQSQLKNINLVLSTDSKLKQSQVLPFSKAYLKNRHTALSTVDLHSLTAFQLRELQYLIIQERYPERFLPWPASVNVATGLNEEQKQVWQKLVITRLEDAKKSKIFYNRYELNKLQAYSESESLTDLIEYFRTYKPRSRLGIYQLPNGKEWYQSKVNHYLGAVESPQIILANIQTLTSQYSKHNSNSVAFSISDIAKKHCSIVDGLNWEHDFINFSATFEQCEIKNLLVYKQVTLVLAEIDLGIHYQAWSEQQAMVVINQKLALEQEKARALLEYVVMKPAAVLSLAAIYL